MIYIYINIYINICYVIYDVQLISKEKICHHAILQENTVMLYAIW